MAMVNCNLQGIFKKGTGITGVEEFAHDSSERVSVSQD